MSVHCVGHVCLVPLVIELSFSLQLEVLVVVIKTGG
jgi:hypothetical protein